jgi:hypothetical protein
MWHSYTIHEGCGGQCDQSSRLYLAAPQEGGHQETVVKGRHFDYPHGGPEKGGRGLETESCMMKPCF